MYLVIVFLFVYIFKKKLSKLKKKKEIKNKISITNFVLNVDREKMYKRDTVELPGLDTVHPFLPHLPQHHDVAVTV